uniref:RCC1-like domain-containing protein n=1 Tax=Cynoglossus semilaevis TaxID=244447 RepID=A0A3P8VBT7_CYNSE
QGSTHLGSCGTTMSSVHITALSNFVVKKVAVHSGGRHAMALTVDGKVFSWGEGDDGKLGHFSRITSSLSSYIACGSSHSAAITSSGELYSWGLGEYGRLGHGDNTTQLRPKLVPSLRGVEVVDIAAGGAHSACVTASGELFTWGKGRYGRLGHGDSEDQLKPKLVSVECGSQFSVALTKSGAVYTWYELPVVSFINFAD